MSESSSQELSAYKAARKAGAFRLVVLLLIGTGMGLILLIGWPASPDKTATTSDTAAAPAAQGTGLLDRPQWSVARRWNERMLDAIRRDYPAPTVHARNLFHVSAAMYDAWAAYDDVAMGFLVREKLQAEDRGGARKEAISYAAYRILSARYAASPGHEESQATFDALMQSLGFDPMITSTDGNTPVALGNRIALEVLAAGQNDGANEANLYVGDTGYQPINPPMAVAQPGTNLIDKNRWQPLVIENMRLQNGLPSPDNTQRFLGSHWGYVTPFALRRKNPREIYDDPGPPPQLGGDGDAAFRQAIEGVIRFSSWLDPSDGVTMDISPGGLGNNTLGLNDGHGYPVNPYTGKPYTPNIVKRGDYGRVLAEFWADGPSSETPPGHWNTLANYVSDHPQVEKRIRGKGPIIDDLEWDVKLYFALNGAVHDAAIAAWDIKVKYDTIRPISAIRYMGGLGQSSVPTLEPYHPDGLPLVPGLIEVITRETTAPGGRHEHLEGREGEMAIYARMVPDNTKSAAGGVKWVRAVEWFPYMRTNFVTPPFAAYVSGHSTFSRAGAEVLTEFTGNKYFPGGLGQMVAHKNKFLHVETGPTEDVVLQWATYYDAADEAGISRLWGGIHVTADDQAGRQLGARCGRDSWVLAQRYYSGLITVLEDKPIETAELAR